MMTRQGRWMIGAALTMMLAVPSFAEVGAARSGTRVGGVILEPDGGSVSAVWAVVRPDAGPLALWPEGEAQGDLKPDLRVNPVTGRPEAVWPYWDGHDYELAWSSFDGACWSTPLLVTDNDDDDVEAAIAFDADGTLGIAFRRAGPVSTILYLEHEPGGEWSPEIAVSSGSDDAYMPSVTFLGGRPRVGYHEVRSSPGQTRVVVAAGGGDGPDPWPVWFTPELVALTTMTSDLKQETLAPEDRLYTVWVHDESELRFSRYRDGVWAPPDSEPYDGPDDIGRAKVRVKVRVGHEP